MTNEASRRSGSQAGIDPKLLELLVCPLTKGRLRWVPESGQLISDAAKLAYPVRDGIPVMLPSEAQALDAGESGS